ncbi:MAG: lactonase family protein [Terracidiphilus sp.]|jgi:6-phosphogluconolactonase
MMKLSRRNFLITASAATFAATAAVPSFALPGGQRVFIGSNMPDGILAYDWDPTKGELVPAGVAASLTNASWITLSPDRDYLFAASEVPSFNGKQTGEVASFRVAMGALQPLSALNSAGAGTCHVALDHTGGVLLAADYGGGTMSSFHVSEGKLKAAGSEYYSTHGPNKDRQKSSHAHFGSFSPDNRFAYMNDLGGDCIHIYSLNATTGALTPAGTYRTRPGDGPRTLHFHPNGYTAYGVNELTSTVDVLEWSKDDGSLSLITRIELLPQGYHGPTRACDTVISKDGKFVYFANRDNNFLYSFSADFVSGRLTPIGRSSCGGKTPRNFTLDPTEGWMLVANQDSNVISVFARNRDTGALADAGKNFPAAAPMCILFA